MNKRIALVIIALTAIFCLLPSQITSADTTNKTAAQTPSGITVSPAFQQVQILADEPQHQLNFSITNNRPTPETIHITTQDFNALSDSGGLFFVGTNPTQLQKKYGLAKWLSLDQSSVTVAPKQTAIVTANIINDSTFTSGGHYGALMLALDIDNTSGSGKNKIAIHPIASSLLFVNKLGGDIHKLKLVSVNSSHSPLALPKSVTIRFYNDDNTHLIPRGVVTITNPKGKVVSQGIINEASDFILPQVYRQFEVPLNIIKPANTPGNYKLTVDFRFDGYDQYRTYQASLFLATPGVFIAIFILGLITIGIGYYYSRIWRQKPQKEVDNDKKQLSPKKASKKSKNAKKAKKTKNPIVTRATYKERPEAPEIYKNLTEKADEKKSTADATKEDDK